MTLEREDIGGSSQRSPPGAHARVAAPYAEARDDYAIFADLAERLGAREAFTEGRSVRQWLEYLYEPTRAGLEKMGLPAPSFAEFWAGDGLELPQEPDDGGYLRAFKEDPAGAPLKTPSGQHRGFLRDHRQLRRAGLSGTSGLASRRPMPRQRRRR